MESEVVGLKLRGRKGKRKDDPSVETGREVKKRSIGTRSKALLGSYVRKKVEGSDVLLGKVVECDRGVYKIYYHDGDWEDMENHEVRQFLIRANDFDNKLLLKRKELDELILKKCANDSNVKLGNAVRGAKALARSVSSNCGTCRYKNNGVQIDGDVDADPDSCTNSCKCARRVSLSYDASVVPPPVLPPSTGNIGVPDECVADLLSVYSFLRTFSIPLFLYPFGLEDFVGSLNCSVQNRLSDAIHVALMRCLWNHFKTLSLLPEGSELASRCLRSMDWSLIDSLTWPVSLVQYLIIMKYTEGHRWKELYSNALQKDYYTLSAGSKLMVLQILCDNVVDSAEIRGEMSTCEESEVVTGDGITVVASEGGPRRVHPRLSGTPACDDQEAIDIIDKQKTPLSCNSSPLDYICTGMVAGGDDQDGNGYICRLCGMDGTLLCCDGCPSVYHSRCIGVSKMYMPEGDWYCPECTINRTSLRISKGSLKGAELFGVDSYEQVFLGTCNHLLVIRTLQDKNPTTRYYHVSDIPTVLQTLHSSVQYNTMYAGLCKAILQYWDIPMDILSLAEKVDITTNLASKTEDGECLAPSLALLGKNSYDVIHLPESEKVASCITDSSSENMVDSLDKSKCTIEQAYRLTSQQVDPSDCPVSVRSYKCVPEDCTYTGTSFKAQSYINHYTHGNYAASAAANLAVLSSTEHKSSESHANILLQVKAFSSTAIWFFWPDSESKLVEVPRERCGWCLSCKAPAQRKKGCLLNATASNAIRGTMRKNSATRPVKDGERSLYGIVTYMIFLEESLHSLTVGPFRSPGYRKIWRKQVEQAITYSAIKSLLLELEENIRAVAFTRDWVKLVDEWSVESTVSQNTSAVRSSQKRGPGGKRDRKQGAMPDATANNGQDKSKNFIWWRGGIVSKLIFQRGMLPCSMAKKSARQGCSRKIPSVSYAEGVEVPKRTRQFVWRAAVEMSNNLSQLAMQIRYLDIHVRWGDLIRPNKSTLDGKGADVQASVFRNAFICDKHYVESQTQYAVDFGSQRELPSRIAKNVVEVEKSKAGKQIYWFLETMAPLYLIKEYEENMEKVPFQPAEKAVSELSESQRRQLKASRKDIFSYLLRRRDNLVICHCASCQLDVLIGDAVKCTKCKGYCHVQCMVSSSPHTNTEVKFLVTCKHCYQTEAVTANENHNEEPHNSLAVAKVTATSCSQIEEPRNTPTVCQGGKKGASDVDHSDEKLVTRNRSSLKSETRSKACSWGLIWKKKNCTETGLDFRLKNILLKENPNSSDVRCDLCKTDYNSDLMYIFCQTCKRWYHADAVELDESKLFELLGFKCCKCRRIKSPICPYIDPVKKPVSESKNLCKRAPTQGSLGVEDQRVCIEGANPSGSLSRVGQVTDEQSPEAYAKSLSRSRSVSVRRHLLQNSGMVCLPVSNISVDLSNPLAENSLLPSVESSSCILNISKNDLEDGVISDNEGINYEDMEFEPQTYFSYSELSTADDGSKQLDGVDPSRSMTENLKKSSPLSSNGKTEQCGMSTNQQAPRDSLAPPARVVKCRVCSLTEPSPDCSCQICGLWMHSHCSPVEESSGKGPWRCVNCREWQ